MQMQGGKGSGNRVTAATGPGPETGLHVSRDGLAGAGWRRGPRGWGSQAKPAGRSGFFFPSGLHLMASRDDRGRGQLGRVMEGVRRRNQPLTSRDRL